MLNEQAKAITKLEELRMEEGKVDEYVTEFETIAPRSGFNEVALLQAFKKGLTERLRKRVNNLDPGPETLDEYKAAAVRTQTKENQEKIENALWRRKPSNYITIAAQSTDSTTLPLPAQTPRPSRSPQHVVGPNGKTLLEYFQRMKGRCTGCGSDGHRKEACDQKGTTCNHCQAKGRLVRVCINKFLGRPAGGRAQSRQRIAASTETPFTLFPNEEPSTASTSDFDLGFSVRVPVPANTKVPSISVVPYSSLNYDNISSCTLNLIRESTPTSSHFRVNMKIENGRIQTTAKAMVDSGATGLFTSNEFVKANNLRRLRLRKPISVHNIDGTHNQAGSIEEFVQLAITVDNHKHWVDMLITDLGGESVILGLPWLRKLNPEIDWSKGLLSIRTRSVTIEEVPDFEGRAVGGTTIGGGILEDTREEIKEEEKRTEEASEVVLADMDSETETGKLLQICVIRVN